MRPLDTCGLLTAAIALLFAAPLAARDNLAIPGVATAPMTATDVATTLMDSRASIVTRRFSFTGAHGDTVWGQIMRLADQTGPIPAILYIHGGPQGSFNGSWSNRWKPQVTALQESGIPSQLLVFPDANHWVLGAKNALQWHNTVFAWLDRWLKRDGEEVSAQ